MTDKVILCAVLPDGTARVGATGAISEYLHDMELQFGEFLPVAAIRTDPELFMRIAQIHRLPTSIPLIRAAELFHRPAIDQDSQIPMFRVIRRLGDKRSPLLNAWRLAVQGIATAA